MSEQRSEMRELNRAKIHGPDVRTIDALHAVLVELVDKSAELTAKDATIDAQAKLLKTALANVFGGRWIDHASDCLLEILPQGNAARECSCGLTRWLSEVDAALAVEPGEAKELTP